jgi:hypothetical protein
MDRRVDGAGMMRVAFWAGLLADARGIWVATRRTGFTTRVPAIEEDARLSAWRGLHCKLPSELATPPFGDGPSGVMIVQ